VLIIDASPNVADKKITKKSFTVLGLGQGEKLLVEKIERSILMSALVQSTEIFQK
jgi:hypothetical protein